MIDPDQIDGVGRGIEVRDGAGEMRRIVDLDDARRAVEGDGLADRNAGAEFNQAVVADRHHAGAGDGAFQDQRATALHLQGATIGDAAADIELAGLVVDNAGVGNALGDIRSAAAGLEIAAGDRDRTGAGAGRDAEGAAGRRVGEGGAGVDDEPGAVVEMQGIAGEGPEQAGARQFQVAAVDREGLIAGAEQGRRTVDDGRAAASFRCRR